MTTKTYPLLEAVGPFIRLELNVWEAPDSTFQEHGVQYTFSYPSLDEQDDPAPIAVASAWFDGKWLRALEVNLGRISEAQIKNYSKVAYTLNENRGMMHPKELALVEHMFFAACVAEGVVTQNPRDDVFREGLESLLGWLSLGHHPFGNAVAAGPTIPLWPARWHYEVLTPSIAEAQEAVRLAREEEREEREARAKQGRRTEKRRGDTYVYVMGLGKHVKVGISKDPKRRARELSVGPKKVRILATQPYENAEEAERIIHSRLAKHNVRNEWFQANEPVAEELREWFPGLKLVEARA